MKQKALKITAHVLGFLVLTLLFVYMTFPTEAARDIVERTARYKAGVWTEIGDLSLNGLSGITLEDIFIQLSPKKAMGEEHLTPMERKAENRPIAVNIDKLSVDIGLLDIAGRAPTDPLRYSMDAELFGGTLHLGEHFIPGASSKDPQELREFEITDVDLRKTRLLRALLPLELEGVLQMKANLKYRTGGPPQSGTLSISIEKALLKSFVAPVNDPQLVAIGLTKIRPTDAELGTIQIEARIGEAKRGRRGKRRRGDSGNTILTFEKFEVVGGEIEVMQDGEGLIQWTSASAPIKSGRINLQLGIKVSQSFIDKEITEKGQTEKPNLMVGMVKNNRSVKQAMRGDWIGLHITGTLGDPTFRKRRPSARIQPPVRSAPTRKPKVKRPPRKPRAKPAGTSLQSKDLNAKRKARRERLKKRREELKRRRQERAKEDGNEPTTPARSRGRRNATPPPGVIDRYGSPSPRPERSRALEPEEVDEEPESEELEEPEPEEYIEREEDEDIDSEDQEQDEEDIETGDDEEDREGEDGEGQTFDEDEEID